MTMTPTTLRARGFSLIEFMVAMTIGLFLVAGLVFLIAETSRSRAEIERSSRQIENGRYAIDRIAERVEGILDRDTDAVEAWEPVPLEIYGGSLPPEIRSSWVSPAWKTS